MAMSSDQVEVVASVREVSSNGGFYTKIFWVTLQPGETVEKAWTRLHGNHYELNRFEEIDWQPYKPSPYGRAET